MGAAPLPSSPSLRSVRSGRSVGVRSHRRAGARRRSTTPDRSSETTARPMSVRRVRPGVLAVPRGRSRPWLPAPGSRLRLPAPAPAPAQAWATCPGEGRVKCRRTVFLWQRPPEGSTLAIIVCANWSRCTFTDSWRQITAEDGAGAGEEEPWLRTGLRSEERGNHGSGDGTEERGTTAVGTGDRPFSKGPFDAWVRLIMLLMLVKTALQRDRYVTLQP